MGGWLDVRYKNSKLKFAKLSLTQLIQYESSYFPEILSSLLDLLLEQWTGSSGQWAVSCEI